MARIAPMLLVVTLVWGCSASHQYTEADHQKTVEADLGTSFTVSLPASADKPAFSAAVLQMGADSRNEAGRRTIEFTARTLGETEIKVGKEFSLRVRVTSASDRPGVHVHNR